MRRKEPYSTSKSEYKLLRYARLDPKPAGVEERFSWLRSCASGHTFSPSFQLPSRK